MMAAKIFNAEAENISYYKRDINLDARLFLFYVC